jgi:hypothetical protein
MIRYSAILSSVYHFKIISTVSRMMKPTFQDFSSRLGGFLRFFFSSRIFFYALVTLPFPTDEINSNRKEFLSVPGYQDFGEMPVRLLLYQVFCDSEFLAVLHYQASCDREFLPVRGY